MIKLVVIQYFENDGRFIDFRTELGINEEYAKEIEDIIKKLVKIQLFFWQKE